MQRKPSHIDLSTASGLAAILLWSTTFAVARSLAERVGTLTAAASVYLVAGVLFLVQVWWAKVPLTRCLKLPRRYLLGCGFLFVLCTTSVYLAVGLAKDREQVLEIALVNYLWPAGTVVLSVLILNKQAQWLLLPGTALGLAGMFLVMTQGARVSWTSFWEHFQSNPAAYLFALMAALSWAFYSNLARRWAGPNQGGAVELFMPVTGLVLLVMRLLSPETTSWSGQAVGEAGLLGAITALSYGLWDVAMRRGNLLLVAACSYFTPLLSTLVSCAYLQVKPGPRLWIGCLLLVAGSLLSWRSVSDSKPAGPEPEH
ncbi:MAG: aromatic amino acid DMT transporter YddG [Verrucomicrobia bacterium]|nr:aromatic amino acid DMT transporter YddG [Verrucomicrobiota bacterium]